MPKKRIESEEVSQAGPSNSSLEAENTHESCNEEAGDDSGNKFKVDHSIRGTVKCKECKKVIAKGELRIGKYDLYKDKSFISFFHVKCAFSLFKRARVSTNVISCTSQVDGMDTLKPADREMITELIATGNDERTAPLKTTKER